MSMLKAYIELTRLNRPIGCYLLLWPVMWALLLASDGAMDWQISALFIAGVVLMRSAGCAINDFADRHFDGRVRRTAGRPLVTGRLRPWQALMAFAILSASAFVLVLFLNAHTILLSFVGLFLAALYPFTKRWMWYPQLFLALAFSWGIPMAFMASREQLPLLCWMLFALNMLWVLSYDTIYAMADQEEDRRIGVRSTALWFGDRAQKIVLALQCLFLGGFASMTVWRQYDLLFFLPWLGCCSLVFYQHRLMRRQKFFNAFVNNHWIGLLLFTGLWLGV